MDERHVNVSSVGTMGGCETSRQGEDLVMEEIQGSAVEVGNGKSHYLPRGFCYIPSGWLGMGFLPNRISCQMIGGEMLPVGGNIYRYPGIKRKGYHRIV